MLLLYLILDNKPIYVWLDKLMCACEGLFFYQVMLRGMANKAGKISIETRLSKRLQHLRGRAKTPIMFLYVSAESSHTDETYSDLHYV